MFRPDPLRRHVIQQNIHLHSVPVELFVQIGGLDKVAQVCEVARLLGEEGEGGASVRDVYPAEVGAAEVADRGCGRAGG